MHLISRKDRSGGRSSSGQSLVEAMLAISILTMGFMGIFALLSKSFFLGRVVANQTTAIYLASEGIEIAKNLIDHDVYVYLAGGGGGWGSCFNVAAGGFKDFQMDYMTTSCSPPFFANPPAPLKLDPVTHLYNYTTGADTTYVRRIRITVPNSNPSEIVVNSIVTWSTGPITSQSINIEDHFYNWHP